MNSLMLTRMGPGEFFGEMNLFGGLQRSATVQAETDTELLVLDRDTLTAVVERNPRPTTWSARSRAGDSKRAGSTPATTTRPAAPTKRLDEARARQRMNPRPSKPARIR